MLAHIILNEPKTLLLLINAVNLFIGISVLSKNPRRLINQSFFVFIVGSCAWGSGVALLYLTHNFSFDKLALGGGLLLYFGLMLFAYAFPTKEKVPARFFLIFIPLCIAFLCLPFNLFIKGIDIDSSGFIQPVNGLLFPFFVSVTGGYILAALYFFRRSYINSSGKSRMQMLYLLTGICVFMSSLLLFDALLPLFGIYEFNLLGPATSLIFVLLMGYAIVRHQLMDIRVVIQRGAIYSLLFSLLIAIYIFLLFLSESFFDAEEEITTPLFAGTVMLIGILTVPHIERYFRRMTDCFFFKDRYDYADALEKLSSVLNTNIQSSEMISQLLDTLNSILHPDFIEFVHVATKSTYDLSGLKQNLEISYFVPENGIKIMVISGKRVIGFFTFGRKRSGDPYTKEDQSLLRTFAEQAAVAFEKAELYHELEDYSKSLEKKVQARTQKLAHMQENQRQLFDDISHALQTPLTVLKGGIELLKNERSCEEFRSIESMEHGVDDLSRLIREILQLARMDSTQTPTEKTRVDLSLVVRNVIEYVEIVCEQNDIRVTSDLEPGITIHGSEKQLEEMITNLLSNAVHYTAACPKREILVLLHKIADFTELVIADTGIGIAQERLPHVFDRFYRAHGSEEAGKTGYGLGLAIVKRIVERHSGTVHAESILGQGTRMVVRFSRNN